MDMPSLRACFPLCILLGWMPFATATVNILFRGSYTGTVWFDDVALQELEFHGQGVFDGGSVAAAADFKAVQRPAVARAATADGLVLGLAERGEVAEFRADGKSICGPAPGGFWIRDVAANGPWLCVTGQARQDGKAVRFEGAEPSAGLRLAARFEPGPDTIRVSGSVADTTGEDRAPGPGRQRGVRQVAAGGKITVSVPLGPQECEVVRVAP